MVSEFEAYPHKCNGHWSHARARLADPGDKFMIRTVRVIVTGRVQGVGYRAWVEQEAETRRLFGWVRNRRDGSVEALFSGEAMVVDAMTKACRSGPRMAVVEKVIVVNTSDDRDLRGFRTIATD
jgi:acylphosphatase